MLVDFTPKRHRTLDLFFSGLARAVAAQGREVEVTFAGPGPADYTDELEQAGVRVSQLRFPFGTASARELARRLRRRPGTVLQAHFLGPFEPRLLALKALGLARKLQIVDHLSGSLRRLSGPGEWLRARRSRVAGLLVDEYVAVSRFVAGRIERAGVPAGRIRLIENGIPLERYARDPRRPHPALPRVAFAGQLIAEKGVQTLLEAASAMPAAAEWVIAGAGNYRAELEALAERLGLPARFLGHVDSAELFRGSDIVVVPSLWEEAFGLVAVEGMAAGAAVVVSDAGGLPEVVADTGVIFPRGDARALAAALRSLLDSPQRRETLGNLASRRASACFGLDRMIAEHADAAESLLRAATRPS
jgi:glycosyltransferase involved in cell wall biosynthesis